MKILRAFLALGVLSATTAMAEDVRVLSGEHADFSRIVLIFGQPIEWDEERTGHGFSVRFDRTNLAFDFTRVFDLIPRDRIRAISFDERSNAIDLESDCSCSMEVFLAGKNTIAIDIGSVPEEELAGKAEPTAVGGSVQLPWSPLVVPKLGFAHAATGPHKLEPVGAIEDRGPESLLWPLAPGRDHATLEEALLRQLGRAASQGLVDMHLPDGLDAGSETPSAHAAPALNATHLASETVFDRALPDARPNPAGQVPDVCPDEAYFDPSLWLSEPTDRAIGAARRDILDARDAPDADAISRLVRTYLSLGFGAEAHGVLREFPIDIPGATYYRSIANILDNGAGGETGQLQSLLGCKGPMVVWAALATSEPSQLKEFDAEEAERWFFEFPPNLRRLLGARLVERLHAAGWIDAATGIRNAMERSMDASSPELILLDATNDTPPFGSEVAVSRLRKLQLTDAAVSAEATNLLLEEAIRQRRVESETIVLAEALAAENRDSEVGQKLLPNISIAHAQLGDFGAALEFHARWAAVAVLDDEFDPTLSAVVEEMVLREDDAALLRFLNGGANVRGPQHLSMDVLQKVAGRLLEIGLWKPAEGILSGPGRGATLRHRQLSAEAALQASDAKLALALLSGEPDARSVDIRARALARLGDHAAASRLLHSSGESTAAAREAWLSGEADLINSHGTTLQKSFLAARESGRLAPAGAEEVRDEPVTLDKARNLLEGSGEMRAQLESLLFDS